MSAATQTLVKASYYRSQLYTAYIGINPLVAAAHPIFSLVERMNLSRQLVFSDNLTSLVEHELKAFETRARDANYNSETIMIARYLLAAIIQESIESHNLDIKLLNNQNKTQKGPARFFDILERIISKPQSYLDLLELSYLCLSTGFKGSLLKDEKKLKAIKENLYNAISQHRRFDKKERPENTKTCEDNKINTKPRKNLQSLMLVSILTIGLTYIAGNLIINHSAKSYLAQSDTQKWQHTHG